MAAFEYRQAEEIRDAFKRHGVKYLFIGKSGAILLGYPDTTQDADLYVEKNAANCEMLVQSLRDIGFQLTDQQAQEVRRGKDFIQLKNGPFDLDLIFAPDGIENFEDAWKRRVDIEGFPVCDIDDIALRSKQRIGRRTKNRCLGCFHFVIG
jgi:hypothetical protein